MNTDVYDTNLQDVKIIKKKFFSDHRGQYLESYNRDSYINLGINIQFVEDDFSFSVKNVLRGLHGDKKTWKLISCVYGKIYVIVLDLDNKSKTYQKWQSFKISDKDRTQILIPPKHGNGHLVLSENAIFHYKQSEYYDPDGQFTVKWNDPKYNFDWPIKKPILSKRDE